MNLIQSDINEIIGKATFFAEWLDHGEADLNVFNEREAHERLETWTKVISKSDQSLFQKRLHWDNWEEEKIIRIFGTEKIWNQKNLPDWAETLSDILQMNSDQNLSPLLLNPLDQENPFPFEELLLSLILVARGKLLKRLGMDSLSFDTLPLILFSEMAYLALEKSLLQKLFNLTANTLEYEFSLSRSFGHNLLNLLFEKAENQSKTDLYDNFIKKNLSDNFLSLFKKYPVLGRFISITIDFWVEATAEFVERLNDDIEDIQSNFLQTSENTAKVINLKTGLSDLHNQHRSVIIVEFDSEFKLVYKPKHLGLEVAFCQFLDWCNQGFSKIESDKNLLTFKVLRILNRENYGWVEFVEHQPCENEQSAQNFYIRAGQLLCSLYFLGGTDCHNENLIACGEHLVLVDMETALQPEAKLIENFIDNSALALASSQLSDSVIRTGLMPMWEFSTDNSIAYDLSGLGSIENQPAPSPALVWKAINTDDMHPAYEKIDRPLEANIPMLNGEALSPQKFVEDLVTGFEQMYRFLSTNKELFKSPNTPLNLFHSQQVRFIFRPTRIYGMLLSKVMTPNFLQHGLDWSIELDVLSRSFLESETKPQSWSIFSEELKALYQLDVPYFSADVNSDQLSLGKNQILAEYFQESCWSQILSRLEGFNEQNLKQQIEIIRLSFYAKDAGILQTTQDKENLNLLEEFSTSPTLSSEQLIAQSEKIAQEIKSRAISGLDDSLSWISLTYVMNAERFQLMPLGYSFYDGNCGIALFFAALAHITGKTEYHDLTLRAIQPLRSYLQTANQEDTDINVGIGGGTGFGSMIYTLAKISKFLQLPELGTDALNIANLITTSAIASDKKFDIIEGAAGAILGLLALKDYQAEILPKAVACGQHLLNYCREVYQNQTPNPKGLTGFSHGASGIAYALFRLYAITQDRDYLNAARQAITYENLLFYPDHGNWREITPIYHFSSPPVFWSTWCHGAPGITLGRLGILSIESSEQILTDIEIGLQTTQNTDFQTIDHVCCGNLGRCETILVASQKLKSDKCAKLAQELASKVVQQSIKTGHYQLFSDLPGSVYNPSFFQGSAGIGYQLLRLAHPTSLPSVLLWE
jgi:type 2 lantibiotic biosynthesis protein LanM